MRLLLLVALVGCGSKHQPLAKGDPTAQEGRYRTGTPGKGWSKVAPGGADRAWFNRESGATIYFDSNCKARFEDKPLDDLITHLTFGMANGDPLREETLSLGGRTALMRVYNGEIDGVAVQLSAVVIKKNSCIYDALYITSPTAFDGEMTGFRRVLRGFKN